MKIAEGLVILVFLVFVGFVFSTAAVNSLQPLAESNGVNGFFSLSLAEQSPQQSNVEHHSHPTKMSLQGKIEGINEGNLGVKVSDQNSCSNGVFFDYNYTNAIQDGLFNLSLGSQQDLNLNYNQDYYLCLYVNGELIGGPQQFRGGQGQIGVEDVNSAGFATQFVPFIGATKDINLGVYDFNSFGKIQARKFKSADASSVYGANAVALGKGTIASGDYSTALGYLTTASGVYSTAMGMFSIASGYASTAVGGSTLASGQFSTAKGWKTTASGYASTAMGVADYADGIARLIASGTGAIAGGYAWGGDDGNPTADANIVASNTGSIALGYANARYGGTVKLASTGLGSVALGFVDEDGGAGSINASGPGSIAVGYCSAGSDTCSITSSGYGSIAMGSGGESGLRSSGLGSIALGQDARAFGIASVSLGYDTNANAAYATAIGYRVFNNRAQTVALGLDVNIARDLNVMRNVKINGKLFGGSPLAICGNEGDACLIIVPEEKQVYWCDVLTAVCDKPSTIAKQKIREIQKRDEEDKRARQLFDEWYTAMLGCENEEHSFTSFEEFQATGKMLCLFDENKAKRSCLSKAPFNYWKEGQCKENPYLHCLPMPLMTWSFETKNCEIDPVKECEAQQDMAWLNNQCVFSQEKQAERLKTECLADRSKYWTGKECIEASTLTS